MTTPELIKQMEELSDKLYQLGEAVCYDSAIGSLRYLSGSTLKNLSDIIDNLTEGLNEEQVRQEHNA